MYTGEVFVPYGVVSVNVQYKNRKSTEELYIVSSKRSALLGRVWIRHLKINLEEIDENNSMDHNNNCNINSITTLQKQFSEIFSEKVGCIPNVVCNLKLQKGAKPVFIKQRQVPFAIRGVFSDSIKIKVFLFFVSVLKGIKSPVVNKIAFKEQLVIKVQVVVFNCLFKSFEPFYCFFRTKGSSPKVRLYIPEQNANALAPIVLTLSIVRSVILSHP